MNVEIKSCTDGEIDYICGSPVEYDLLQVPRIRRENFIDISRKITDENGNILAGSLRSLWERG